MLGLITSDTVAFAVVIGIPAAVAVLVVIWARPRSQVVIWGAVSLGIVVVSAAGLTAALRGGPVAAQVAGPPTFVSVTQSVAPTPTSCIPKGADLHLVAKNTSFDVGCLASPAHLALSISFENQDAGIAHSFHILTASPTADPSARTLFLGKIVTGPGPSPTTSGRFPPAPTTSSATSTRAS